MNSFEDYDTQKSFRKPGRPDKISRYAGKCDVRLSSEEDRMLDKLSNNNGVTRSDVMRRALRDFYKFNSGED